MNDEPTDPSRRADAVAAPITQADLHGYVDGQLTASRHVEVDRFLAANPDQRVQVADWQMQNGLLRAALLPALDEPIPLRLPLHPEAMRFPWRGLAAGLAIAVVSAASAWSVRGSIDATAARLALESPPRANLAADALPAFARRAAVAHVVYSPDARRPVEVGADQEQALVNWLTKRMGTPVHPPALSALGYALIGGRLLPGEHAPVAQFMYAAPGGQRLTLYVTHEAAGKDAAFKFGREGEVNVFYWVEGAFGYAISAGADRAELLRVSEEVYRQSKPA